MLESGPDGLLVRDSGSANGVFVNGKKVDRARLKEGDVVKMGDVLARVLGAPTGGTVVRPEPDDRPGPPPPPRMKPRPPAPARELAEMPTVLPTDGIAGITGPPDRSLPRAADAALPADAPEAFAPSAPAAARPLFVRVLVVLWGLAVPAALVGGAALAWNATAIGGLAIVVATLLVAALGAALAYGLWQGRGWARTAAIAAAGVGVFVCPLTLAAIAVLVYLLRPEGRTFFAAHGRRPAAREEAVFTGALVGGLLLGLAGLGVVLLAVHGARTLGEGGTAGMGATRSALAERTAVDRLRTVYAAEEAFHGVCNTGYGDLAALRRPANAIENYPPEGPAFLRDPSFDAAERGAYRFSLRVEDEMPPAPGCPKPRYRRFLYTADPIGHEGRHLVIGPDGVVRAAERRPATLEDPPGS